MVAEISTVDLTLGSLVALIATILIMAVKVGPRFLRRPPRHGASTLSTNSALETIETQTSDETREFEAPHAFDDSHEPGRTRDFVARLEAEVDENARGGDDV